MLLVFYCLVVLPLDVIEWARRRRRGEREPFPFRPDLGRSVYRGPHG